MNKSISFAACAFAVAFAAPLIPAPAVAEQIRSAETVITPEADDQQPRSVPKSSVAASQVRRIELAPLDSIAVKSALAVQDADKGEGGAPVPQQIGFGRDVLVLKSASATGRQLTWQAQADGGQAAAVSIASPGAVAIRLGVRIFNLPEEAVLRLRASDDSEAFDTSGQEILDLIEANVASGDTSEDAYTWWAPAIEAEEAVLEIILPPGVSPKAVEIALPTISHLFASVSTEWKATGALAEKAATLSCHKDVQCYTADKDGGWDAASRATTRMAYTQSGGTYLCTGTLLNDTDATTTIPYLLTANHCISTQTVASTLQTYWFYRTTSCGSKTVNAIVEKGGSNLLWASASTDTSLLRLKGSPPSGVAYAGWQVGTPTVGVSVTGIHHPVGDPQKIAFGSVSSLTSAKTNPPTPAHSSGKPAFIEVKWSDGETEPGSSGSGLFDSNKKLIGQLLGGRGDPVSCKGGINIYGRFDLAYNDKLHEYLDPTLSLSSPSWSAPTAAASSNVTVTTNQAQWTATSNQSWLTVSPASGKNGAQATLKVTANTTTASRTGTVTFSAGGKTATVAVTQAGKVNTK
ncbi:MAG: trypsin-like peptidase domain-containing protein [Azoarcus sp.]|jgi:hypothetical protein|nr:trypsin-like peptidase domain-containing protein [Azoarcus sp.]